MASEAKKAKVDEEEDEERKDFHNFRVVKVLNESSKNKFIAVEGRLGSDDETPAVLMLEKMPFNPEKMQDLLLSSSLRTEFKNDIYGKYECFIAEPSLNSLKANLIYPATEKHIAKYSSSASYIINETPSLYETLTLPFIKTEKFSIDWVYNILSHQKETERIVYEDSDPESGFVLLPDFKWSCKQVDDLYLLGIVHNKRIKSLRDLNHRHLPLLRKMLDNGTKAIFEKYGVHHSRIRAYVHYQPSYYHFHVHFTALNYDDPGIKVERAHMLSKVIRNIERQSDYYTSALIPFVVKESDKLFGIYLKAGYDFGPDKSPVFNNGLSNSDTNVDKLLEFFKALGKAKHEPCGEHWDATYGESAWRMAIMVMCLTPELNRKRLLKVALSSAFTCIGKEPDQNSEWEDKLNEVRNFLCELLPLDKAAKLYELYSWHVNGRRGVQHNSLEGRAYRKILELEEAILLWEEVQKEGTDSPDTKILMKKMKEVGFPGMERMQVFQDETELENLLTFILKISELTRLPRTGWVRSGVRDPERVASHMFRMAVMAMLFEEDIHDKRILNGSAVIISLVHDMAECIVGDLTPSDNVAAEEKHNLEINAMMSLVKNLPTGRMALEFFNAFERYEEQHPGDNDAKLAKDLDKFDMVMQAYEYEDKSKKGKFLQDFFDSTKGIFKVPEVIAWDARLRQKRHNNSDDDNKKDTK